ncbi:DUF2924 domain-containing protein [Sphingobium sp.]|uniref:DUF2924 domain-containing protein n=1 Tax=Sphingobium sp. TaxID=1912891 RepID=UPI002C011E3D|nr:DUF2924 domain-containing protein [Sphingobium sp.]HUD91655.1 DUF2924 domain-containing protein [Sphingobium sp.]
MSPMDERIEEALAELESLSSAALRERWSAMKLGPAPRISPAMLRLALAWEIQARALGGHERSVSQALAQAMAAKTATAPMTPGLRLVREWRGKAHVVTVGEDRIIRWNEKEWGSLSEVARAITGTRWSGPAFFGMKSKAAA